MRKNWEKYADAIKRTMVGARIDVTTHRQIDQDVITGNIDNYGSHPVSDISEGSRDCGRLERMAYRRQADHP
jgi:hypothetical protein